MTTDSGFKNVGWNEFFPMLITYGQLSNNQLSIPQAYVVYALLQSIVWGSPEDIESLAENPEAFRPSQAKNAMFEVNISMNTAVNTKGEFESADGPLTEDSLAGLEGFTDLRLTKATLLGTSNVPVAAVEANLNGKPIFFAYVGVGLVSRENTVVMIALKGGQQQENKVIWQEFANSLGLKV